MYGVIQVVRDYGDSSGAWTATGGGSIGTGAADGEASEVIALAGGIFRTSSSAKVMNAWLPLAGGSKTTPGSP